MGNETNKMNGESLDISAENRARLKALFPSVFTESKNSQGELIESLDFEKLKAELGTFTDLFENRRERYGMDWPGKKDALRLIQTSSLATLKPCREESVNFDTTENLFIEGDNLEVLKLLQKSYYGKVKMIYIDPPYNTGKEFIYPDNFSESLETYLEYAGMIDGEGKKFSTNTANEGRFHTKWLNMMYPRLYLARNLLKDDGVIFISIDDYEIGNIRKLIDDVFGEENLINNRIFVWHIPDGTNKGYIARAHEYILGYAKNFQNLKTFNRLSSQNNTSDERCTNAPSRDNPTTDILFKKGLRYEGNSLELTGIIGDKEPIEIVGKLKFQDGILVSDTVLKSSWRNKDQINEFMKNDIAFDEKGQTITEIYFDKGGKPKYSKKLEFYSPKSVQQFKNKPTEETVLKGLSFNNPKPVSMIEFLASLITEPKDIILDFFSGSATTAHAVLDLNKQDGGNRKFILVQLPEPCAEESEAFKAGYKTIADIGKERIRRVIKKLNDEQKGKLDLDQSSKQDRGFKVLKLDKSNFKQWQKLEPSTPVAKIEEELALYINHIDHKSTQENLLYEILLKAGFTLTEKIETKTIKGKKVFSVAEGTLLLCLEDTVTKELIDAVAEAEPRQFICLDSAFHGNDQLKANAVQTFAARNMQKEKHNQIVFKTV